MKTYLSFSLLSSINKKLAHICTARSSRVGATTMQSCDHGTIFILQKSEKETRIIFNTWILRTVQNIVPAQCIRWPNDENFIAVLLLPVPRAVCMRLHYVYAHQHDKMIYYAMQISIGNRSIIFAHRTHWTAIRGVIAKQCLDNTHIIIMIYLWRTRIYCTRA